MQSCCADTVRLSFCGVRTERRGGQRKRESRGGDEDRNRGGKREVSVVEG